MRTTVTAGTTWVDGILIVLAIFAGAWHGTVGTAVLTGCAAGTAIGVWRCVTLLGHLLERAQADAADHEDA
jgi:hypothetical protein